MGVLYRKYRPQFFREVAGQDYVKKIIAAEIKKGEVAHAFLFVGPRGVGKTTLARLLAKSLNCEKRKEGEFEPCGKCPSCQSLKKGNNFYVIEIDAASHTGVDNVRENIIAVSQIAPPPHKYKVFIIDEAHMLSMAAFNALLKILEEPPERVVFILATTEGDKIPPTIVSRCQRFVFTKISSQEIIDYLRQIAKKEKRKIEERVLTEIAYLSQGCLRDAENLLGQIFALGEEEITWEQAELILPPSDLQFIFNLAENLIQGRAKEAIEGVQKILEKNNDLQRAGENLKELFRKILLIKVDSRLKDVGKDYGEEYNQRLQSLAKNLPLKDIFFCLNVFQQRLSVEDSFTPTLPLEMAIVEICQHLGGEVKEEKKPAGGAGKLREKSESVVREEKIYVSSSAAPAARAVKEKIEEKKCPKKKPKAREQKKEKISLVEVEKKWPLIIEEIKKYNNSLSSALQTARLTGVDGDRLAIAFQFSFHQKKIKQDKNRRLVEDLLFQFLNQRLLIDPQVDKNAVVAPPTKTEKKEKNEEDVEEIISEIFQDDIS